MKILLASICAMLACVAMLSAQSTLGISVVRCNAVTVQLSGLNRVPEGETPHTYSLERLQSPGVWALSEKIFSPETAISLKNMEHGTYRVTCVAGEEHLIWGRARQNKDVVIASQAFNISDCPKAGDFPATERSAETVGISVYPNPANDEIHVFWETACH
jgi:hypothetical protein